MFQPSLTPFTTKTGLDATPIAEKLDAAKQQLNATTSPKLKKCLQKLAIAVGIIALIILTISILNIAIVLFNACGGQEAFSFRSCPTFGVSQILAFVSPGIWASLMTFIIGILSAKLSNFSPNFRKAFLVFSIVNTVLASPALIAVSISQVSSLATTFSNATELEAGLSSNPPYGGLEFAIPIVLAVLGIIMFVINGITLFFVFKNFIPSRSQKAMSDKKVAEATDEKAKSKNGTKSTDTNQSAIASLSQTAHQQIFLSGPAFPTPVLLFPRRFYPSTPFSQPMPFTFPTTGYSPAFQYPVYSPQPSGFPQYYVPPPYAPTLPSGPMAQTGMAPVGNSVYQVL